MYKLTKKEKNLLNWLLQKEGQEVTIEEIINIIFGTRKVNSKRTMALRAMRLLTLKCAVIGCAKVERITRLGVGSTAVYKVTSYPRY